VTPQFFSKFTIGAPFRQKLARKSIKKRFRALASRIEQRPIMATLILAQHNNQPTIPQH
jgi:hypothetical protein